MTMNQKQLMYQIYNIIYICCCKKNGSTCYSPIYGQIDQKSLVSSRNTWNHIIVCRLCGLRTVNWNYNFFTKNYYYYYYLIESI